MIKITATSRRLLRGQQLQFDGILMLIKPQSFVATFVYAQAYTNIERIPPFCSMLPKAALYINDISLSM